MDERPGRPGQRWSGAGERWLWDGWWSDPTARRKGLESRRKCLAVTHDLPRLSHSQPGRRGDLPELLRRAGPRKAERLLVERRRRRADDRSAVELPGVGEGTGPLLDSGVPR